MRGYHYTSWENWLRIQDEGLKPYPIKNPAIQNIMPVEERDTRGIFVFKKWKKQSVAHYGQLMWAMMHRHALNIVLLSMEYERRECYHWGSPMGTPYTFTHGGHLATSYGEPWHYHVEEPAELLLYPIPPERITLEAVYDFARFVDNADEHSVGVGLSHLDDWISNHVRDLGLHSPTESEVADSYRG